MCPAHIDNDPSSDAIYTPFENGEILVDAASNQLVKATGRVVIQVISVTLANGLTRHYEFDFAKPMNQLLHKPKWPWLAKKRFEREVRRLAQRPKDPASKGKLLVTGGGQTVESTGEQIVRRQGRVSKTFLKVKKPDGSEHEVHIQTHHPLFGSLYVRGVRPPLIGRLAHRRFNKAKLTVA